MTPLLCAAWGTVGCNWGGSQARPNPDESALKPAQPIQYTYANDHTARLPVELRPQPINIQLAVMNVEVPQAASGYMEKLWNHLRESAADDDVLLRLRRNGFRLGIGSADQWSPVQALLDAAPGAVVHQPEPMRMPVGVSTALEMDRVAREQTLFFVGDDGILTGNTWANSRNVLKLAYAPDARQIDLVRVMLVPEVRQNFEGLRYVKTDNGMTGVPREYNYTFDAAGVSVPLKKGEYIVLAPSEAARVEGLIGWALLSRRNSDVDLVSYLFIRPEFIYAHEPS